MPRSPEEAKCPLSPRQEAIRTGRGRYYRRARLAPTLAPHKEVIAFDKSRNICYEIAFGISCDTEGYAYTCMGTSRRGTPCSRPNVARSGSRSLAEALRHRHQEDFLLRRIMEHLPQSIDDLLLKMVMEVLPHRIEDLFLCRAIEG